MGQATPPAAPPTWCLGDVELRPATVDDALCLSVLATQVFLDTYALQGIRPSLAREVTSTYAPAVLAQELSHPQARGCVAQWAGHWIGFAHVVLAATHERVDAWVDERVHVRREPQPAAELLRLYVQRPFMGLGVGRLLLDQAERTAREGGAAVLWLTAWVHNHRARAFYAQHGYADCGGTLFTFEGETHDNRVYAKTLG